MSETINRSGTDFPKPLEGDTINAGLDNLKVAVDFLDQVISMAWFTHKNTAAFLGWGSLQAQKLSEIHDLAVVARQHLHKASTQVGIGAFKDSVQASFNVLRGALAGSVANGTPEERAAVAPFVLGGSHGE